MSSFLNSVIEFLQSMAQVVPLEAFVVIGSIVEEMIAPIPSPFVMSLAGSLAQIKGEGIGYLVLLAVLGSIGKTATTWLIYIVADKMEDVVMKKIGKYIGVTHAQVEQIGQRLKKGWQDNVVLFVARALPLVPSAPVSFVCGAIKLDLITFLTSTFLGNIVRNFIFLYLGYTGIESYKELTHGIQTGESIMQIVIVVVLVGILAGVYYKRRKLFKDKP
jgi:membrane protein DedA with SNARE-associated domain